IGRVSPLVNNIKHIFVRICSCHMDIYTMGIREPTGGHDEVRSHHQNSGEAIVSKAISGSELLTSSERISIKRQSDKARRRRIKVQRKQADPNIYQG
ncbi:hypothetical protein Tco_0456401, partial [Tanacetum coccineum]